METEVKIDNKEKEYKFGFLNVILSYSYIVFLSAVILGVIFDIFIPHDLFSSSRFEYIGLLFIFLGSLIAYWAQYTSKRKKNYVLREIIVSDFERGPYKYLRHPTHFGVFVMIIGFSLIINSLFSIIFSVIAYTIVRVSFQKKEEKYLENKYGQVYLDYKKEVKNKV